MTRSVLNLSQVENKTLEHLESGANNSAFKASELSALIDAGLTLEEVLELVLRHNDAGALESDRSLTVDEIDRVYKITRVIQLAERIFGDQQKMFAWFRSPNSKFGGATPMSYLTTGRGGDLVEDLLLQINYGMVS